MAEHLYLRLLGERFEWLLLDEATGIVRLRGNGDLTVFANMVRDMSWSGTTRVLLAGEDILLTHAKIPARQQRQILQAVPYMVEESLATDVDSCHFAPGPRDEQGDVSVAVIARDRLQSVLEVLAEVGIKPASVTPDVLHLPGDAGVQVLIDGDRAIIRTGRFSGFAMEQDLLPAAINLLDEKAAQSLTIHVHPSQHQAFQLYLSQIEAEYAGRVELEELAYSPFEFLCRSFDAEAINLLQGEFKAADESRSYSAGWRGVAVLLACAFGLQVMLLVGRGVYLDVKANQYQQASRALYAQVFPDEHNVRDVRRRWQAHIASASGKATGVFFDLFTRSAQNLPGSQLELENVNFSDGRGDLILQLSAPRYDAFDQFAQTLRKSGLDVQIGTINQAANVVKGSVRIKRMTGS